MKFRFIACDWLDTLAMVRTNTEAGLVGSSPATYLVEVELKASLSCGSGPRRRVMEDLAEKTHLQAGLQKVQRAK